MKALLGSVAAIALLAAPAAAQMSNSMSSSSGGKTSTKTMVTKGAKSTATTTVTTKVMPNKSKGKSHKAKKHHAKKKTHKTAEGLVAHDFRSLLAHLGTRSRVTYQVAAEGSNATFQQISQPDQIQAEALRLLQLTTAQPDH